MHGLQASVKAALASVRTALTYWRAMNWRFMAVLAGVSLAVKLAVLVQLHDHPLLQPHGDLDTAYYIDQASRLASGDLPGSGVAFFVSPLYVYFLAAVFATGGTPVAAQVVQTMLGAVAVGLGWATARHWFGERAAWVGAVLALLTATFTFNEVLLLQSALDPFLVSLALFAVTRVAATGSLVACAGAGISLGLLSLNRPNAAAYAVVVVAGVAIARSATRKQAFALAAALVLAVGLNAARNYAASGEAVAIASHGGLNLYIGNHERADGTYTPVEGITPSIAGQAVDAKRVAEAAAGRSLSSGEVSSYFARQALAWATAHPGDAARLTLRKVAILLNATDVPLNYSMAFYASEPGSLLRALVVGPWLLLPLGLIGLLWPDLRVNQQGYWLWAMFVPVYGATVVLFFVADRYRMPLLVPLCGTAGATLLRLVDLARTRRFAAAAWPAAGVAVLLPFVLANRGLDDGRGGEQTRMAGYLVEQGRIDDALQYVARVLPAHTHPGVLQFRVGLALSDAGRDADAIPLFTRALEIDGTQPAIQLALGEALLRQGSAHDAIDHLEAAADREFRPDVSERLLVRALMWDRRAADAVRRLPRVPETAAAGPAGGDIALDFGTLALEGGATSEAVRWTRLAVTSLPGSAEAHEKYGLALLLSGQAAGAVAPLERARDLDSSSASVRLNLAVVYAQLGRTAEARQQAVEARRLDPSEPRASALLDALAR